jgi:hypothetical protein
MAVEAVEGERVLIEEAAPGALDHRAGDGRRPCPGGRVITIRHRPVAPACPIMSQERRRDG